MSDIETAAAIQLLVRRVLPESLRVSVKKARAELTEKQKRAALSLKYQKQIEKMTESKLKIDKFRKIIEQFDRDVRIAQSALEFLLAIAEQKGIDLEKNVEMNEGGNINLRYYAARFVNEPEYLFEFAKHSRKSLKTAEKELEKARKTKKHIESHQWNIEDYAAKIAEAREKIQELEKKVREEEDFVNFIQQIADFLKIDIEKNAQMNEGGINIRRFAARYVNRPEHLFEVAKHLRKSLKTAEKELKIAKKAEKCIQKNDENFETRIAEAREKIQELEKKVREEEFFVNFIQQIADFLKIDIEDTWRRSFLRLLQHLHDRFQAPRVFVPIPQHSIWFFEVLLTILVFYVYFTF
ncbi:hypothetical protein CRE_22546 [Caenorhabditis remanei]|uniref:Uncharacterized protein n=1 Tax=Caenorhabditis remanei TaxID=31234 RepID=E3MU30_CAERE|nr:hypothetical protein CRE_22546 [Caenorhabditis remanei]